MTMIIDPQVGPYSPLPELVQWQKLLETMPESFERDTCLRQVANWIKWREEYELKRHAG